MVSLREWLQPMVVKFWLAVEQKEESSYLTKEKPLPGGFYFYNDYLSNLVKKHDGLTKQNHYSLVRL